MKALVLGATGYMGGRAAVELARSPEITGLVLASRDDKAGAEMAARFGGPRRNVSSLAFDIHSADELASAWGPADVVVNCAGPGYALEGAAVAAAARTGTPYVSLNDDHPGFEAALESDAQARASGATIVSGCGMSPGITNLLAARARQELDSVSEIEVAVGASSRDAPGPASGLHFLFMLAVEAPYLSEHRRASVRGGTSPRPVYFPEPVGWVETFHCGHPEILSLGRADPDLGSAQFRLGLTERAVMDAGRALVTTGLGRTEAGRRIGMALTRPARPLLENLPPRGPEWTAARVDVHGSKDGRPHTVSLGVADHLTNLATIPLTQAALELGSGRASRPGVHAPEDLFEAGGFLAALSRRGIRIARLEPFVV